MQVLSTPSKALDIAVPKLSRDEELYAISITDLTKDTLGGDAAIVVNGDAVIDPRAAARLLLLVISNGSVPEQLSSVPLYSGVRRFLEESLGTKSTGDSLVDGIGSLRNSVTSLSKEESENLNLLLTDVGTKVLNKVLDRLVLTNK